MAIYTALDTDTGIQIHLYKENYNNKQEKQKQKQKEKEEKLTNYQPQRIAHSCTIKKTNTILHSEFTFLTFQRGKGRERQRQRGRERVCPVWQTLSAVFYSLLSAQKVLADLKITHLKRRRKKANIVFQLVQLQLLFTNQFSFLFLFSLVVIVCLH